MNEIDSQQSQVRTFIYSPEQARRRKRNLALFVSIPVGILIVSLPIVTYLMNPVDLPLEAILLFLVVGVGIPITYGFFKIRFEANSEASLKIVVKPDRIVKEQLHREPIVILRLERPDIQELPSDGMWVQPKDHRRTIFIPARLSGYLELKSILADWSPIRSKPNRNYIGYLVLGGAILLLVLMFLESTQVYAVNFLFHILLPVWLFGTIAIAIYRAIKDRMSR